MNIINLNSRITIQQCSIEIDEIGNHLPVWHDYYDCWACITSANGRETNRLDTTLEADLSYFTIRYCKKISNIESNKFRIIFRNHIYNIDHVDHLSYENRLIKIHAKLARR